MSYLPVDMSIDSSTLLPTLMIRPPEPLLSAPVEGGLRPDVLPAQTKSMVLNERLSKFQSLVISYLTVLRFAFN